MVGVLEFSGGDSYNYIYPTYAYCYRDQNHIRPNEKVEANFRLINTGTTDTITVTPMLRRVSDGALIISPDAFQITNWNSGQYLNFYNFEFTFPDGKEGTYELVIGYSTQSGGSGTIVHPTMWCLIDPTRKLKLQDTDENIPSTGEVGVPVTLKLTLDSVKEYDFNEDYFTSEKFNLVVYSENLTTGEVSTSEVLNEYQWSIGYSREVSYEFTPNSTGEWVLKINASRIIDDFTDYFVSLGSVNVQNIPATTCIINSGISFNPVSNIQGGEQVDVSFQIKNGGQTGTCWWRIKDVDEDEILVQQVMNLNQNQTYDIVNKLIGEMPNRDWNLRIETGHGTGENEVIDQTYNHTLIWGGNLSTGELKFVSATFPNSIQINDGGNVEITMKNDGLAESYDFATVFQNIDTGEMKGLMPVAPTLNLSPNEEFNWTYDISENPFLEGEEGIYQMMFQVQRGSDNAYFEFGVDEYLTVTTPSSNANPIITIISPEKPYTGKIGEVIPFVIRVSNLGATGDLWWRIKTNQTTLTEGTQSINSGEYTEFDLDYTIQSELDTIILEAGFGSNIGSNIVFNQQIEIGQKAKTNWITYLIAGAGIGAGAYFLTKKRGKKK